MRYRMAMIESSFVRAEVVGGTLVAAVLCERVSGREAPIVEAEVSAAAAQAAWRVAVDLGQVLLLTSMGLGALMNLHKVCRANGGKLAVFGLSDELMRMLKLTHLDRVLTIAGDRQSAIEAVS